MSWLPVEVTVAPASEPVSLAEAKAQCRVDGTDEDTLIGSYIEAARTLTEAYTGTKLVEQTVVMRCSGWFDLYDLPAAPVRSITSITYLDTEGVEQTLTDTVYENVLTGLSPLIRLKVNQSFPATRCVADAIRVTAVVGYETLPATIWQAMQLAISNWFDNRSQGALPDGTIALLANYRRF